MAGPQLDTEYRGIVLLGSFTPEVFHPGWFAARALIRPDEAEAANIVLMAPEVALFHLPWADVRALSNRVDFTISEPTAYEAGRDLVASLGRVVGFPVRAVGLNHHTHWKMPAEHGLDRFGASVAETMAALGLNDSHLRSLETRAERQDEDYPGAIGVTMQPSDKVSGGVYVSVNDHYDLAEGGDPEERTERFLDVLSARWDMSGSLGAKLAEDLINATVAGQ